MGGGHKEWHSRGYLPHFDHAGTIQSLTFRLADSLPQSKQHLLEQPDYVKQYREVEGCLDVGYGACLLGRREYAELVRGSLGFYDGDRYRLLSWVIMPNHVHCVIEQLEGWPLGDLVAGWKGFTSQTANRRFGRSGVLWARDYYDRCVRDVDHYRDVVTYLHQNPVKARLVERAEDWEWSSARDGEAGDVGGRVVGADGSF